MIKESNVEKISLVEISQENIIQLKGRSDLLINFSLQFGNDCDYSEIYKKYTSDDEKNNLKWLKYLINGIESKKIIHFFFIKLDDIIIGYFYLVENIYFNNTLQLKDLFIDINYRGKGYGTIVMEKIIYFIKFQSDYKNLTLNVLDGNLAARKLYKKFGFTDFAHLMFKELN